MDGNYLTIDQKDSEILSEENFDCELDMDITPECFSNFKDDIQKFNNMIEKLNEKLTNLDNIASKMNRAVDKFEKLNETLTKNEQLMNNILTKFPLEEITNKESKRSKS